MAETDISKIVGLILENPSLVEEIKGLMGASPEEKEPKAEVVIEDVPPKSVPVNRPSHRRELLEALKPYISEKRRSAVDSFAGIADILDMMRAK